MTHVLEILEDLVLLVLANGAEKIGERFISGKTDI